MADGVYEVDEVLQALAERFAGVDFKAGPLLAREDAAREQTCIRVAADDLLEVMRFLRDDERCRFDMLADLTCVDYLDYPDAADRFGVTYTLVSTTLGHRLWVKCFANDPTPQVPSVTSLWKGATWPEREVWDMFGVRFEGHPDLRRLLTDYGFIGHPFRKDFPLSGNVEVRYDPEKKRVIYQPVSIEPRVLVPKVIRTRACEDEVNEEPVTEEVAADEGKDE